MVIMTRRIKSSLWGEEIHLLALNYVLNLCGRLVCTCYVTPQILTDRASYRDSACLLAPQVHCHQTRLDCTGSLASSQCASALTNFKWATTAPVVMASSSSSLSSSSKSSLSEVYINHYLIAVRRGVWSWVQCGCTVLRKMWRLEGCTKKLSIYFIWTVRLKDFWICMTCYRQKWTVWSGNSVL